MLAGTLAVTTGSQRRRDDRPAGAGGGRQRQQERHGRDTRTGAPIPAREPPGRSHRAYQGSPDERSWSAGEASRPAQRALGRRGLAGARRSGRLQQAARPSVVGPGELDDDGPHLAAVGVGAVPHVGRPEHGLAVHHASQLVADLHEAPAADDDEQAGVGVVVRRDHGVRAEGQLGDAAASVLVEHLGGDPGGARRPFRAAMPGPETADVHGRRRAPPAYRRRRRRRVRIVASGCL